MSRSEVKEWMRDNLVEACGVLSCFGLEHRMGGNGVYVFSHVEGVKVEWNMYSGVIRLGYGNTRGDLEVLGLSIKDGLKLGKVKVCSKWVDVYPPSLEDFKVVVDTILSSGLELESPVRVKGEEKGVVFEGTDFSNAHERMTTLGPRFMSLVCKAAGMELEKMDAEWVIESGGRIDGVELNDKGDVISIYECQSGIQKGNFLDDEHLYKALLRYPFDSEVIKNLKKIVILAGGYNDEHLKIIDAQAKMFEKREIPIEIVLLQTVRLMDRISVIRLN